jgi:preprotein translocase subunit SecF
MVEYLPIVWVSIVALFFGATSVFLAMVGHEFAKDAKIAYKYEQKARQDADRVRERLRELRNLNHNLIQMIREERR